MRKVKEGETTNDLYAFLTTEPNAEIGAVYPKAMPVILTTPEEVETWTTAPSDEALKAAAASTRRDAADRRPRCQGRPARVGGMTGKTSGRSSRQGHLCLGRVIRMRRRAGFALRPQARSARQCRIASAENGPPQEHEHSDTEGGTRDRMQRRDR